MVPLTPELSKLFKSIVDQGRAPVVVCDTMHIVVYMNPAAIEAYKDDGGSKIIGTHIFDCHSERANEMIRKVVDWFAADKGNNSVHTFYNSRQNKDVYMVALRDDDGELIGYYEKHEYRNKDDTPFYEF
ncbi:MAG: PAS domain-containing protein [Candidatus Methanomethylophilaceae archaeon]|nr:PAS domain-containing protein [Candidatus Methanomethylophilaceae archaeon]